MYLLQYLAEASYICKENIVNMGFIERGFTVLNECSRDDINEYGDIEQTLMMTFSKIT